ncbi:hypothetical protein P2R12_04000 [Cytobacillus oceanisediminis]|nr:hypothetical protein [Cytobacillus oceanisediminis]MDF2036152.1 hypothetical protein [Cytobacillus oceanisediminis]
MEIIMKKMFKFAVWVAAFPFILLWTIFFDSSGNSAMFVNDVFNDKK